MNEANDSYNIKGAVNDEHGHAIPGVTIYLQFPDSPPMYAHTRANGHYSFFDLQPGGPYKATFSLEGLRTTVKEDIQLMMARTTTIDVTMMAASK